MMFVILRLHLLTVGEMLVVRMMLCYVWYRIMIRGSSYYIDYQRYQIAAEQNNSVLQKTFYSRYFEYILVDKYSRNILCTY